MKLRGKAEFACPLRKRLRDSLAVAGLGTVQDRQGLARFRLRCRRHGRGGAEAGDVTADPLQLGRREAGNGSADPLQLFLGERRRKAGRGDSTHRRFSGICGFAPVWRDVGKGYGEIRDV